MTHNEIIASLSKQVKEPIVKQESKDYSKIKDFNALDLPLYFKHNVMDWYYRVRVKNGKVDVSKIITGKHYFFGTSDLQNAFDKDNIEVNQKDWNEAIHNIFNKISD